MVEAPYVSLTFSYRISSVLFSPVGQYSMHTVQSRHMDGEINVKFPDITMNALGCWVHIPMDNSHYYSHSAQLEFPQYIMSSETKYQKCADVGKALAVVAP